MGTCDPKETPDRAGAFQDVFKHELELLRPDHPPQPSETSEPENAYDDFADRQNLVGLALSGGGIRSATFNLGVLQGLAKCGLLARFDYLSTVSGGGYIGTWLQAWLWRARKELLDANGSRGKNGKNAGSKRKPIEVIEESLANSKECSEVRFLREHSNYLTPRVGLLSADTWTIASIYLRNLLLNLVVMTAAIGSVFCGLRAFYAGYGELVHHRWPTLIVGSVAMLIAVLGATANLAVVPKAVRENEASAQRPDYIASRQFVLLCVVLPTLVGCWAVSAYVQGRCKDVQTAPFPSHYWAIFAAAYVIAMSAPALGRWYSQRGQPGRRKTSGRDLLWVAISTIFAAGLAGAFFFGYVVLVSGFGPPHVCRMPTPVDSLSPMTGPLLLTLGLGVVMAMHFGIAGSALSEQLREWQARFSALLVGSAILLAIFGVTVRAPSTWQSLAGVEVIALPTWVTASIGSVWASRSSGEGRSPVVRAVQRGLLVVGPYIFVLGFLVSVAFCMDGLLRVVQDLSFADRAYLDQELFASIALAIVLIVIAGALSWRFGINDFSIGALYRNRLVRCYLGAIHQEDRRPNYFTGFAESDDRVHLSDLGARKKGDSLGGESTIDRLFKRAESLFQRFRSTDAEQKEAVENTWAKDVPVCRPYVLYNATLNLVGGSKLAWQRRRARPFVFTPAYCGFALSRVDKELVPGGTRYAFRPSDDYASNISLGTAMSISGAAVSPNMGDRTTAPLAFLLTIFNLRLGRWLPNPRNSKVWRLRGPRFGLGLLAKELLGLTQDEARYVYLSDGGHFENLGLYELVRRRCRFIVVSDAGQDSNFTFEDLGNAIERIRTDRGVDIKIDLEPLRRDDHGHSRARCAVGVIDYDDNSRGYLLYVKATLTGGETADIARYAAGHTSFPHESTADQWFDESQFESYRRLGEQCAREIFGAAGPRTKLAKMPAEELFSFIRKRWHARLPHRARFPRHTEELNRIVRSIRADDRLAYLAHQLFPEFWQVQEATPSAPDPTVFGLPQDPDALRAGLFVCNEVMQLMENVYLDMELDTEAYFEHPDNRGWINLFRHWSWSSMFRVAWAVCSSSYGARFQLFCEQRFELAFFRDMRISAPIRSETLAAYDDATLRSEKGINFYELKIMRACAAKNGVLPFEIVALKVPVEYPAATIGGMSDRLDLNCGVAAIRGRKLLFFRIQDHLRRMGLGRRGLLKLLEDDKIDRDSTYLTKFGRVLLDPENNLNQSIGNSPVTEQDLERFGRMFESVSCEVRDDAYQISASQT